MSKKLIHEHRYFLGIFAIYLIAGAFSFLFYKQGSETLFFDRHHIDFFDFFFVCMTRLAEGPSLTLIALVLLIARVKYVVTYLIDLLAVGIVVGLLKHNMFPDHIRPSMFFGEKYQHHFVEGLYIFRDYSFPSGHTALAFAVFFLLAIYIRRTWVSMVLLVLALLVGLSRIYLIEHFWIDVYFGSLAGILITFLVYIGVQKPVMHSEGRILCFSIYERYLKRK